MNNFINGYISRNSLIHKMNPALKILMFICFVILVFLPLGLIIQMGVWVIVTIVFFLAKLPRRIYFSTIKSIIFMFLILFFINWFTYRNPGYLDLNYLTANSRFDNFLQIGYYQDNTMSQIFTTQNFFNANDFPSSTLDLKIISPGGSGTIISNATWADFSKYKLSPDYLLTIGRVAGANLTGFQIDVNSANEITNITPVMNFQGYALSTRTFIMTLFITQKIYIMILLATILTSTSTSIELTFAIEQLLSPFKLLKLPVNSLAMTISIAIRFVPSLLLESQRILNAQASRGIDFKNGNFLERGHALVSLIVPMVSIAFRNAGELSNAMEARSYNPRFARTRYRIFQIHFLDWLFYLILMLLVGFGILITAERIFFAFFGSPDWMAQGYSTNVIDEKNFS